MIKKTDRIWELDFLRGVAIFVMVFVHMGFDSDMYLYTNFQPIITVLSHFAFIFIALAGMGCVFSHNNIKRFGVLTLLSAGISITSYIWSNDDFIFFGILHMLALSTLLYSLIFRHLNNYIIGILAIVSLCVGFFMNLDIDNMFTMILGISPIYIETLDFFPVFPWIGAFLVGIILARRVYKERNSRLSKPKPKWINGIISFFEFLGRHTLLIYIIHQPILLVVFWFIIGMPMA